MDWTFLIFFILMLGTLALAIWWYFTPHPKHEPALAIITSIIALASLVIHEAQDNTCHCTKEVFNHYTEIEDVQNGLSQELEENRKLVSTPEKISSTDLQRLNELGKEMGTNYIILRECKALLRSAMRTYCNTFECKNLEDALEESRGKCQSILKNLQKTK